MIRHHMEFKPEIKHEIFTQTEFCSADCGLGLVLWKLLQLAVSRSDLWLLMQLRHVGVAAVWVHWCDFLKGPKSSICHHFVFLNSGQRANKSLSFQDHLFIVYLLTLNFLLLSELQSSLRGKMWDIAIFCLLTIPFSFFSLHVTNSLTVRVFTETTILLSSLLLSVDQSRPQQGAEQ